MGFIPFLNKILIKKHFRYLLVNLMLTFYALLPDPGNAEMHPGNAKTFIIIYIIF